MAKRGQTLMFQQQNWASKMIAVTRHIATSKKKKLSKDKRRGFYLGPRTKKSITQTLINYPHFHNNNWGENDCVSVISLWKVNRVILVPQVPVNSETGWLGCGGTRRSIPPLSTAPGRPLVTIRKAVYAEEHPWVAQVRRELPQMVHAYVEKASITAQWGWMVMSVEAKQSSVRRACL